MGREVRHVAADWEHPVDPTGRYEPMFTHMMPRWREGEEMYYQMYETTTAGTPISPPMESPERLARWLVEDQADAGIRQTASYEAWLRVCQGTPACTFMTVDGEALNGVEAGYQNDLSRQREDRMAALSEQRNSEMNVGVDQRPAREREP